MWECNVSASVYGGFMYYVMVLYIFGTTVMVIYIQIQVQKVINIGTHI